MHVPYNFGHTIEKVALVSENTSLTDFSVVFGAAAGSTLGAPFSAALRDAVRKVAKPNAEIWGHFHPDIQTLNKVTGCGMFFSPQKYWPKELAESYFGNKTVFGMLRDPAERLVAMFRGNFKGYGGGFDEYHERCDVNAGLKKALKRYAKSSNKFSEDCAFLPQAEYFDGPHGIALPVDNRLFPDSMNKVFEEHGYSNMHIRGQDVIHVSACEDVWAADLDQETRALIRKEYARDYELLCKHFNYCDPLENTCIAGVKQMCPPRVLEERKLRPPE